MKVLERVCQLREAIQTGELVPGEMIGTETAFSQQWQLSRDTVRRGIETLVKEGLVERRPGKGLYVRPAQSSTRSVQIVIPNLAWPTELRIARGAQSAGSKRGIQILLHDSQGSEESVLDALKRLPQSAFDGAIIHSLHDSQLTEALFELKSCGYPFVLVDQRPRELEVPTVEIDNYHGGYIAGQKLAELGHQQVAFLGPLGIDAVRQRLAGFRDAMLDIRKYYDRSLAIDLGGHGLIDWIRDSVAATEEITLSLLSKPDRPTAIFDGSGDVTLFVYRAAQRLGLRIPQDLSIVTFEDCPFGYSLEPEVTRLEQPWREVGQVALELLLEYMGSKARNDSREPCEHRVLPSAWVPGGSLAPPATKG